ncbi:MAG: hypothetical protein K2J10_05250 [Muribaculaceae bacterium]|nr:hypothetical protein [Muribaculaceae bacterium]
MKHYTTLILLFSAVTLYGFDHSEKIYESIQKGDYCEADSLLSEWQKVDGLNPELDIARFNRYINESRETFIMLTDDSSSDGEALIFTDSLGNPAGSIRQGLQWNDSLYNKALIVIRDAIDKYPSRLDMRFGHATALAMRERTEELVDALKKTLSYGNDIKYKWLWQDNEPLDGAETEMIEGIWDFTRDIYNGEQDSLAYELSAETLKYFPDDLRFINLCGAIKYLSGSYNDALNYFNKALAIFPEDVITRVRDKNISYTPKNYKDTQNRAAKLGSPDLSFFR